MMILMVVLKYHASIMLHVLMYQHLELVPLAHLVLVDTLEMELFVVLVSKIYFYTIVLFNIFLKFYNNI